MKKLVLVMFVLIFSTILNTPAKAQNKLDQIAKEAQKQKELVDELEKLQRITNILCATAYPDTCKRRLEIISMDTELVEAIKSLRSQNIRVVLYSSAGGFNQSNYIEGGAIFIWAGHDIPEIRKFFGLQDLFPADLMDRDP